jgi:2-keto-4-pentenoate hydratase/2-oxohepta-3-ene-1,7-dioic acid hydratase in catechol pathway
MRLITFRGENGAPRAGALMEGGRKVLDLQAAHQQRFGKRSPRLASVLEIVRGGQEALDLAGSLLGKSRKDSILELKDLKLLAPIPQPPQMRDFLCFEKHLVQAFEAVARIRGTEARIPKIWYERPIFYHPSRFSVCGTEADVPWPSYTERLDFELEFGCYIGKPGNDIANDFSARDEQTLEMMGQLGPGKGKDFDNANAMGPCLVTADELRDPYRLEMKVRVNGEEWGRGNSRDMHWKFEDCIAHVSRSETLHPGEFLGSGTVGNGCGLEHMRFLEPGDVVELEVEGIGVLRNRVVKG